MYPSLSTEAFFARADKITRKIAKLFGSDGQSGQIPEIGYPTVLRLTLQDEKGFFSGIEPKFKFYSLDGGLILGDLRAIEKNVPEPNQEVYKVYLFQIVPNEVLCGGFKILTSLASVTFWNRRKHGEITLTIKTRSTSKSRAEALCLLQKINQFIEQSI